MKVFDRIKKYKEGVYTVAGADPAGEWLFEETLQKTFSDLIKIRKSESLTKRYFENRLCYTLHTWEQWRLFDERKKRGEVSQDEEFVYKRKKGEVILPSQMLYLAMMDVLSDDKYSFWYIYYFVAQGLNRLVGEEKYHLEIIPQSVVEYAVDFDPDILCEIYSSGKQPQEKYDELLLLKCRSEMVSCDNDILSSLKSTYEKMANQLIDRLEVLIIGEQTIREKDPEKGQDLKSKSGDSPSIGKESDFINVNKYPYFNSIPDAVFQKVYALLMACTKDKRKPPFSSSDFVRALRTGDFSRIYVSPYRSRIIELIVSLKDKADESWFQSIARTTEETVRKIKGTDGYSTTDFTIKLANLL